MREKIEALGCAVKGLVQIVANKIENYFRCKHDQVLGIYEDEGYVEFALAEKKQGSWQVVWQKRCVFETDDYPLSVEVAVGSVLSYLHEDTLCYLVLTGADVLYYEKEFPDMPQNDLQQAVKWDFTASASWQEKYLWGYEILSNGYVRIGGIKQDDLARCLAPWQKYLQIHGAVLFAKDRSSEDDGQVEAAYGAIAGAGGEGIIFSVVKNYIIQWHWLKAGLFLWLSSTLIWFVLGGGYWWQYQEKRSDLERIGSQMALMDDVKSRKQTIDEQQAILRDKYQQLANLHNQGLQINAMLTELSVNLPAGVWLTGISADSQQGKTVSLTGKAAGYQQLSELIELWCRKDSFFHGNVMLKSTDTDDAGIISFQLEGVL